ncbi:hypothetical protein B0H17DRAFT_843526, partial [Mycena rosella]
LRKYELDEEEWAALRDLLRDLTLKFSEEGIATIAHVVPAMDKIDEMLYTENKNGSLNPAAHRAAPLDGKKIINKYYQFSDSAYAYHIAMILHPGLKLKYFERQEWEQEWIKEAKRITKNEFE